MEEDTFVEFESFDFENNKSFHNGWSALANVLEPNRIGIEFLKAKVFFFSKYVKPIELEKYVSWKKLKIATCNQRKRTGDEPLETYIQPDTPTDTLTGERNVERENHPNCTDSGGALSIKKLDCEQKDTSDFAEIDSIDKSVNVIEADKNSSDNTSSKENACDDLSTRLSTTHIDTETEKETVHDKNKRIKTESREKIENNDSEFFGSTAENENENSSLSFLEIASHIQNGIPIPGLVTLEVHPTNLDPTPSSYSRKPKPWEAAVTIGDER